MEAEVSFRGFEINLQRSDAAFGPPPCGPPLLDGNSVESLVAELRSWRTKKAAYSAVKRGEFVRVTV